MQNEDEKNRLRVLSVQQNVPLRIAPSTPTQQVRVTTPYTPPAPAIPQYSSLGARFRDIIDANTQQDIAKRLRESQAASYAEQQRALGNTRPDQNIGQALFREPLTLGATQQALARIGLVQGPKLAVARLTGNKEAERNVLRAIEQETQRKSFGVPTAFGQRDLGEKQDLGQAAKRFAGSALGTAAFAIGGGALPNVLRIGVGAAPSVLKIGGKEGLKALGKFVAAESVAGAFGGAGSVLTRKPEASAREVATAAAVGAGIGAPTALAAGAFSAGINRAITTRTGRIFVNRLAEETDSAVIRDAIKEIAPDLADNELNVLAKDIAQATTPEEVQSVLSRLATQEAEATSRQAAVNVAQPATQALDNTAQQLAQTTNQNAVRESIEALFPNLDNTSKTNIVNTITETSSPETVKNALQQAQTRSEALSRTVREATPPVQTAAQQQAEAAARLVEQPPVRVETPTPVTRTPEAPTPTAVQGAVPTQPSLSVDLYQTPNPSPEQQLNVFRTISPDRVWREYVGTPIVNYFNKLIGQAQVSQFGPARLFGRLATGINRELGISPELLAARKKLLQGTIELGKINREDVAALGRGISETVNTRVWATLDPELAKAKGINITVADLTPEELAYRDSLVPYINAVTEGNASRNLITSKQAIADWFKRGFKMFDFGDTEKAAYQGQMTAIKNQYKGRKGVEELSENTIENAITNPSYLLAKKVSDSHAAWAIYDYSKWLLDNGYVSDTARPGFRQLPDNKLYGEAAGKYVPTNISEDFTGFQYTLGKMNAINNGLTWYDNLKIRKAKKAVLTVLSPGVRLGNETTNRLIFAQLGGMNPATFNKNFARTSKLIADRSPLYIEAVRRGLTGVDNLQRDFADRVAEYMGDPNMAQRVWDWARKSYSRADDNARLAGFITLVERGYTYDEAARLVQRAFQDYSSVGFFYDIAAKTPIAGNAFARFAGDAARILTNRLVDQPFTLASSVAGIWALGQYLSRLSGETEQDKAAREGRFAAPKIPFTDISLEFQTPWGAVNVARFMPFYNLNEINGNLTKFLPIAGNLLDPKNWQDPLLGQVMQMMFDKDFRGKSIKEPENVGQFRTPTDTKTAVENRVRFALTQNVPLGREIDALYNAYKGQPDVYGGERNIKQAIGRALGIKVQKFGPEEVQKLKENEAFFADKKFIEDQLATLPKDSQEKYKKLTGYYKIREQVDNVFAPGKKRYVKEPVYEFSEDKNKDLSSDPKLYDLLLTQKVRDNQRDGKPIPPEFDIRLSNEFRKQLIENKSLRPGDDLEADERMFSNPEWDTYQKIKDEYTAANKKFYPQTTGEFNDELVKHQNADFPTKPAAYQAYSDAYAAFAKGQGPKPTFNDAVKAGKDQYNQAKLDWVNKERKARGLAPISPEVWNNVTFGFTSDEEKVYNELRYGKGLGGFGFGDPTSPEYKAIMEALKQLKVTVKPLEIISAAPRRNVRLARVRVPTSRRARRIQLR